MTAQINDRVFHQAIEWNVAGVNGDGLFDPQVHGIQPGIDGGSTACWRGFHVGYAVEDGRLEVSRVTVYLMGVEGLKARAGRSPAIGGVLPKPVESEFLQKIGSSLYQYDGLKLPVDFTGGLLLGDGFIPELYVHMGFHPAWKYRQVRELLFEGGVLVGDMDRSFEMEEFRQSGAWKEEMAPGEGKSVEQWVKDCFSLDYARR